MDRDSSLIFENYKKNIVLKEAAAVAALPIAGIEALLAGIVGTAGVVVIGNEIKKTFDRLSGQQQSVYEKTVQTLNSILEKNDTSPRGCYQLINFIKSSSNDKTLIEFAQTHEQILKTASYLSENMAWDKGQLESLVTQSEGANTQLANYARVTFEGKDALAILDKMVVNNMQGGSSGGSGGGPSGKPPKPPKRGGWFAALMAGIGTAVGSGIAAIWNKVTSVNWKFLSLAAVISVIVNPELAKDFTKRLTTGAVKGVEGAIEGTKEALEEPSSTPKATPKPSPKPSPSSSPKPSTGGANNSSTLPSIKFQ